MEIYLNTSNVFSAQLWSYCRLILTVSACAYCWSCKKTNVTHSHLTSPLDETDHWLLTPSTLKHKHAHTFYLVNSGLFLLSLPVSLNSQHSMSASGMLLMFRNTVFVLSSLMNSCILTGYTDPCLCNLKGQIATATTNHTAVTQAPVVHDLVMTFSGYIFLVSWVWRPARNMSK